MKHILLAGLMSLVMMMSGGSVMALSLTDGTDVGGLDTLLYSTSELANSGDDAEIAWVNDVLGLIGTDMYTTSDYLKDDDFGVNYSEWQAVDGGSWAYSLASDPAPDYFLIKTGKNGVIDEHFLFQNEAGVDWAVVSLDMFADGTSILDIDKLSHIGEFAAPVPEPVSMLLFGTGLLGLAGLRRGKKK